MCVCVCVCYHEYQLLALVISVYNLLQISVINFLSYLSALPMHTIKLTKMFPAWG